MTRYLCMLTLAVALVPSAAEALSRTWPSAVAPCNTTLQACVDGSGAFETVLVAQNSVIAESVHINKPFFLLAADGYRPVLGAGFVINGAVNVAGVWSWQVEGFELQWGFIALTVNGGTGGNVVIRNNRIRTAISGAAEISVFKPPSVATTLNYDISQNELNYFWDTFDGGLHAAIQVLDSGTGNSSGRIRENRVVAFGNWSIGILVNSENTAHRSELLANQVRGGRSGSIYLRQGSLVTPSTGTLTGYLLNNVVRSLWVGSRTAAGIKADANSGSLVLNAWHNTVVDALNGIDVFALGPASGAVVGNLLAYLSSTGLRRSGTSSISDRDNLFFQTSDTPATPGLSPTSVFTDPLLQAPPGDPHLRPGSPAIDHLLNFDLLNLLTTEGLPMTDGDGLRRFKNADCSLCTDVDLDIGALEAGDLNLLHRVPNVAPGNLSIIDDAALNDRPTAMPQMVGNWNPDGSGGIYNDHPDSLSYSSGPGRWLLRQEDLQLFSAGAAFNLFVPAHGTGRYQHLNTPGNVSGAFTTLNQTDLNGHGDAIVLATRNPGSGTITDLAAPLAVTYFDPNWTVARLDGLAMPSNGGFNIYFQEPSSNAFRHQSSPGNIAGDFTMIDHPLLNGHRCARFQVTRHNAFGPDNNHHIGVFYLAAGFGRWAIFNQDQASMVAGAEFNVLVDPTAIDCPDPMFANGFE